MLEELNGKVVLIHHWDTDGICSAAMLLNHFKDANITNWTPYIGAFYITPEQINHLGVYDHAIIVDISLPEENILSLSNETRVTIFDHHHQSEIKTVKHINPVALGSSPEDYPSCTWVIREHLNQKYNLLSILGLVGDLGSKIEKSLSLKSIVNEFCVDNNTCYDELLRMVQLIDSSYQVGDREGVTNAARYLQAASQTDILNNPAWLKNKNKFDETVKEMLHDPPEDISGVLFKKLDTCYSVISTITREIAWSYSRNTVVLNIGFFPNQDQLYARSQEIDMRPLIERAKMLGLNAGGKSDVLGVIIPKDATDAFLREVIQFLKD
jgi:single-stranded DNA-specific DHH superfamily exonuclease